MKNNKPKIGSLRLIPAGTRVWLIAIQEMVRFEKDMVVKVTNTISTDDNSFFGKLQVILFEHTIPGIMDRANGDVGTLSMDETEEYELPEPKVF